VTHSLDGAVELLRFIEKAAAQLEFELSRPRKSEERSGLARALLGRLPTNTMTRGDHALESFLRALWEIYAVAAEHLPKTSIGAPGRPNAGKAGGPFIRFCRASLDWVLSEVPPQLFTLDPKLRKAREMTDTAIRHRLQRAVDFGTMRRSESADNMCN
jgi:hypothetical protein